MCGIAGVFSQRSTLAPYHRDVVAKLNVHQRKRGPDGDGLWCSKDNDVVLGHRRLAIIDTGNGGAQPMQDITGRWSISFNGEIYNYRALREELENADRRFYTNSDTEVLINVIAEWGESGLKRLRGMFAFALWDEHEKTLWLARDTNGIKPLYIAAHGDQLWFASQARALAECAPVVTARDAAAVTGFYLWGSIPEPFSWWSGIRMFPPGHVQRFVSGHPSYEPVSYCDIRDIYLAAEPRPLEGDELHDMIRDSVRHHMVADTPVGIFLSAGIDSNVIAAAASEVSSELQTVTLAFDEYAGTPQDEAPLAEALARALGSDHATVRISRNEFEGLIDDFFAQMDQPSMDGLNTFLVSRAAASQGLKVALSGLGGDELFGGYPAFRDIPRLLRIGRLAPVLAPVGGLLSNLARLVLPRWVSPKLPNIFAYSRDLESAYCLRRALHLVEGLPLLLDESWVQKGLEQLQDLPRGYTKSLQQAGAPVHAQISALESGWYMRNQLLRDADWASMAHGLEVRVPYVDTCLLQRLAPAIMSVCPPTKSDLAGCASHLSQAIKSRRKTGFTTPVRSWIAGDSAPRGRGLHGWADTVHRRFRTGVVAAPAVAMQP